MWQGGGVLLLFLKMSQSSIDDVLIFDASDRPYKSTATGADLDVYIEYTFQAMGLDHGSIALGGCVDSCVGDRADAFPALSWCDQLTVAVVRCENAVVAGEVDAGFGCWRRSTGNESQGFEGDPGCFIPVRGLQGVDHLAR